MKVVVLFYSLNDEVYDTALQVERGPFNYVQMTYDGLRSGDDGQTFATFDVLEGDWVVDGTHYSDFEVQTHE